ncbi:hypothetical protein CHGG_02273 [Chaetomium globosum CBS 148.51]|uniref:Uncharacterized protein n=1 Tax=Chaetomium globosum (strain ATCC 6205 / CBS 148.51 / DSM 1962 / NBRC 6347 / NRRL 1970) TaxID=306901 RepID=Q2HBY1_CHAGB|nr:uncharacterized protein CHGG_02273 [Chaetomium globosum CBS 148.51]EAQ90338.1 hypothetical protein CHGG_02273 [Chaetomium globosum CBS 148.51]
MQQPVQDQHHRQRNKLHKPADPRSHRYTDSGVGMTGQEPIQPSTHDESNWNGPEEAIGGGTYVRDYAQPTSRLEPTSGADLNTATTSAQPARNDTTPREDVGTLPAAAIMGGMSTAGSDGVQGSDLANRPQQTSSNAAPYWGSLPTGTNGAVHNTVAGHGSATDDHNEHHHLPPKSTSPERSVIAGGIANYPRGGVYNTVTGHGSQDQEATRHHQSRDIAGGGNMAGVVGPANDNMLAAPLSDIPEGQQKTNYEPTLIPKTAVSDDVILAEAASRDAQHSREVGNPGAAAPRAFPLVEPTTDNRDAKRESTSPSRYGAAAGAAAAAYAGQHRGRKSPPDEDSSYSSPHLDNSHQTVGQSTSPHLDNRHQTAGAVTGKRRPSQQRSQVKKSTSRDEGSPKGEKKHRILGIFHRHKDEGKEDTHHRSSAGDRVELAREDTVTVDSPNRLRKLSKGESAMQRRRSPSANHTDPEEQPSHNKEKAAAGAAAGAGALGFLHHRKRNSISEKPKDTTNPTLNPRSVDTGGAGPAGETLHQVGQVSTPFEHPREPPMPLSGQEQQPGTYNVLASGTPSGVSHGVQSTTQGATTNEPGNYNTLSSGTASGVNPTRSEGTRRNVVSNQSGDYNVLASSGEPQAAARSQDRNGGVVTQEPGHYNTLASGIPSGIDRESSVPGTQAGNRDTATDDLRDDGEPTEYNVLPSGTASGVKVKPKSHRHSNHATAAATSGINQPTTTTGPSTTTGDDPQHTFPSGTPIPLHLRRERERERNHAHHPNASQESVPGITSYAHPDSDSAEQHMSPEVMPAAYTATAHPPREYQHQPQHHPHPQTTTQPQNLTRLQQPHGAATGYTQEQYPTQQRTALGMSPAVMPAAYTASVNPPRESGQRQQQQYQHQRGVESQQRVEDDRRFNLCAGGGDDVVGCCGRCCGGGEGG